MDKGYLIVKNCIDLELADEWIDGGYRRLGYDRHDPATWQKDIIWMKHANEMPVRRMAPRAWDAILDVVGGEDRLETTVRLAARGPVPGQLLQLERCLHRQFPARRRQALAAALAPVRRLAQGRRLLPALPRQPASRAC